MKRKRGEWSPKGYLFAAARKICRWGPNYRAVKKAESCAVCKRKFKEDETKLADHIQPVIDPNKGFETWDIYYQRLFTGQLQALCKDCHASKTKAENKIRRARRKAKP